MARVVSSVQVCKACGKKPSAWAYQVRGYYQSVGSWKTIYRFCWNCGLKQLRQLIDLDARHAD